MLGRKKLPQVKQEDGTALEGGERPETDAERDTRVARSFVEIVLRLIKGERVSTPTGVFAEAMSSTSYTSTTTLPGLVMMGLFDVAVATDTGKVREKVDRLLMGMPRATVLRGVDAVWKEVVEGARNGAGGAGGARAGGRGRSQARQQRAGGQTHGGGRFKRKRG